MKTDKAKKALEQMKIVSKELNTYAKTSSRYGVDDEALYCYLQSLQYDPDSWGCRLTHKADNIFKLLLEKDLVYSQEDAGSYENFIDWIREDLVKYGYAKELG